MAVPTLVDLHRPILEILDESGKILTKTEIIPLLAERLSLTQDDLQEKTASGANTKLVVRTGWAVSNLKRAAGLLEYPNPGKVRITPQGRDFLAHHPGASRIEWSEMEKWGKSGGVSDIAESFSGVAHDLTPDKQIALSHSQHQSMLAEEILENLKGISPSGFERLVVGLLATMGYGDGQVTGKSGDQGIDGVLDEDTLGLEKVCVQAKRYDSNSVGEPEIRNFAGSLDGQGAVKGVFITTSTFSSTAQQAARDISLGSKSIRLIDGRELAGLMIKHGVGVRTIDTYEVKELDANYFAEV